MSSPNYFVKKETSTIDFGPGGGGCDGELGLEDKVLQLQETLKTFRAEVDLKMTIMEQILTTRNRKVRLPALPSSSHAKSVLNLMSLFLQNNSWFRRNS